MKLPEFQRQFVWRNIQVMELYDSLRQGFPIGSFLAMNSKVGAELAPREFMVSSKGASTVNPTSLILDGQQRITAGLILQYGPSSLGINEY